MASQVLIDRIYSFLSFPLIAGYLLLFFGAIFYLYNFRHGQDSDVPFYDNGDSAIFQFRKRWMFDSINLLREGYYKFRDQPFKVWTTEGVQMCIPAKYIDALKMLPDHTFPSSLRDFMQVSYTMAPVSAQKLDYVDAVLSAPLTKTLPRLFPYLQEEIDVAIPAEFPHCEDWTPVTLYGALLRIVCRTSGRMSVGPSLNRNKEWIDISSEWTRNVFLSAVKLKMLPAFLRPFGSRFIPEIKKCRSQNARARELITPIIQRREQAETQPLYDKPNDAIEWLRDILPETDRKDYTFHGIGQLAIGALSIHTVNHLTTNTMLNLAAYPEYVPILKEEIENVLAESEGEFTFESMAKLKKLDSFLSETLRCEHPSAVSFQRKVLRPITLYDGTVIPAGTLTFSPADAISTDSAIYPNADTFDGLRFYNLHQAAPEAANTHLLTSIGKTQMNFGAGRHACPGRWFASVEIKLIVAAMIRRFEFRLMEGEGRPGSLRFQHRILPDPKARILVRERKE